MKDIRLYEGQDFCHEAHCRYRREHTHNTEITKIPVLVEVTGDPERVTPIQDRDVYKVKCLYCEGKMHMNCSNEDETPVFYGLAYATELSEVSNHELMNINLDGPEQK